MRAAAHACTGAAVRTTCTLNTQPRRGASRTAIGMLQREARNRILHYACAMLYLPACPTAPRHMAHVRHGTPVGGH